ncbi:MAG: class I SAM-dependent methyltransferase [Armatimonadia bacterium]
MIGTKPWHDDDRFWDFIFERFYADPKWWERASGEVDHITSLLSLPPGAAVLDLCCGPGRHSLELARRGFQVTGVDRTARYLDEARKRAAAEDLAADFIQQDMREFCREGAFDVALNLFSSFGYFEDPLDDRRVVENLYASLKPGGRLLIDTMGKEVLARVFNPRQWEQVGDVLYFSESRIERDWSWIHNHHVYLVGSERYEVDMDHRLYSAAELKGLLTDCGFTEATCYGSFDQAPYDHTARRLIITAVRSQ